MKSSRFFSGSIDEQEDHCESCKLTGLNGRPFAKQKKSVEVQSQWDGGRRHQWKSAWVKGRTSLQLASQRIELHLRHAEDEPLRKLEERHFEMPAEDHKVQRTDNENEIKNHRPKNFHRLEWNTPPQFLVHHS
mmetsp:Transcript_13735/g.19062  ORF Transcript_13735/g.19062 Transcript_13735/m.19062 type:complete len:133 (+) Transcript_13735:1087-1485(+)